MNTLPLYTKPKRKRGRVTRKYPERELQATVVQHLLFAATLPRSRMLYASIPNEGKRSSRTGAHLKRIGMRPGAADLLIVIAGKAHFLELKAEDGEQSDNQIAFQAECDAKGIPYAVATGIDEALAVLRRWRAI